MKVVRRKIATPQETAPPETKPAAEATGETKPPEQVTGAPPQHMEVEPPAGSPAPTTEQPTRAEAQPVPGSGEANTGPANTGAATGNTSKDQPTRVLVKIEPPATPAGKQEATISPKAEPTEAKQELATDKATEDNMHRCNTASQLGSPGATPGPRSTPADRATGSGPTACAPPDQQKQPDAAPAATAAADQSAQPAASPTATPPEDGPDRSHAKTPDKSEKGGSSSSSSSAHKDDEKDDDAKSLGGSTSFSEALGRELKEEFERLEKEDKNTANKDELKHQPGSRSSQFNPDAKRRRSKTIEEKAIHAKFMRFTRHIQSFSSFCWEKGFMFDTNDQD